MKMQPKKKKNYNFSYILSLFYYAIFHYFTISLHGRFRSLLFTIGELTDTPFIPNKLVLKLEKNIDFSAACLVVFSYRGLKLL
jgi:hypothetical protein